MTRRRFTQVKNLKTLDQLRTHLVELGVDLPVADVVEPEVFAAGSVFRDGGAGAIEVSNRFATLPMEGWDGTEDGRPTDLVRRRWQRLGESGAGLVWGEATAVVSGGRANPNQLVIDESTVDELADLRALLSSDQVTGLQLTHSGRYARPDAAGPAPRTAYRHPLLDERVGADDASVLTDDELDTLVDDFVTAAVLAERAGFDFVDVKACHGYLGHELLTAYDRPGRYGGDLAGRTTFLRSVIAGIRDAAPSLAIAVRVSLFDLVPFAPGTDGVGVPVGAGSYGYAFGGDGTGLGVDLDEPHQLLDLLTGLGVGLVCITAGSPYYCPHVQRPAYFPPSDGYLPPEDPLVGVARMLAATAEVTQRHPDLTVVGTGYSYLQEWLPNVAQGVLAGGGAHLIGLGRMVLSYPDLPADVLAGRQLTAGLICRTFSDCTTAPRAGLVSGCYPLDPFYKERPERVDLTRAKRQAKST